MGACAAKQEETEHNTEEEPVDVPKDGGDFQGYDPNAPVDPVPGGGYDGGVVVDGGQGFESGVVVDQGYSQGQIVYDQGQTVSYDQGFSTGQLRTEFNAIDADNSGRIEMNEYVDARMASQQHPMVDQGYSQGQMTYNQADQGQVVEEHGYYNQNHQEFNQNQQEFQNQEWQPASGLKPAQEWNAQPMPVYSHNRQVMVSDPAPQMRGQAVEENYVEAQALPEPMAYDPEPQQYKDAAAPELNYHDNQQYEKPMAYDPEPQKYEDAAAPELNYQDNQNYGYAVEAPHDHMQAPPDHRQAAY